MKQLDPRCLPDELVARAKDDPAFRADVIKNLTQAIGHAEALVAVFTADLERVNRECALVDTATAAGK